MSTFATQSAMRTALRLAAFEHAWAFYRNALTPARIEHEYATLFHLACRLRRAEEASAPPGSLLPIAGRWFCYCQRARGQRAEAFRLIGVDPSPVIPDHLIKLPPAV